jgi:hypothetical protein
VRRSKEREAAEESRLRGGELECDGASVRVAEQAGVIEAEGFDELRCEGSGSSERRDDVAAALGTSGAGKIEGDDVEAILEGVHERAHGIRATHEAVEKDERWLAGGWGSLFEKGETNTVN